MPTLAEEMKAHALEAQKFSRKHLVLELDFSEASIRELENHYDTLVYALKGGLSPENIALLTRMWGAYIGESLRRAAGAEWIEESAAFSSADPSARHIGLKGPRGTVVYPHEIVARRLVDKNAANVLQFFQQSKESLK
jgi:hypothetical protein